MVIKMKNCQNIVFIPPISLLLPADIMRQVGSFNSAVGVKKFTFLMERWCSLYIVAGIQLRQVRFLQGTRLVHGF